MSDQESSTSRPFWSWKVWAIAIVPALVGGLFAIGPTIYQELSKPRAVLSFSRVAGPTIGSAGTFRKISLIRIENTGRTPLTNVIVAEDITNGEIENSAISTAPGLKPITQNTAKSMNVVLERMLPTEALSISVMTSSQSPQEATSLTVRSNEALGSEAVAATSENKVEPALLAAVLAVAGATLTASTVLLLAKRRWLPTLQRLNERPDIITYVLSLSGTTSLLRLLPYQESLSYRRAADMLLFSGMSASPQLKRNCLTGLRAFLAAAGRMNEESAAIVRANLGALGSPITDDEFKQLRAQASAIKDLLEARAVVLKMFQENGS
jgi:hypothetical protein